MDPVFRCRAATSGHGGRGEVGAHRMGASVEVRRYPGMAHTVNEDELDACRALLRAITAPPAH